MLNGQETTRLPVRSALSKLCYMETTLDIWRTLFVDLAGGGVVVGARVQVRSWTH